MTPYGLQRFHARHLMPGTWWFHKPKYIRIWLQSLLFCSELLLDCIHARLFEIQYLSNVCDFTQNTWESNCNQSCFVPSCFWIAMLSYTPSEIQYPSNLCFHIPNARESDCNWYYFVPSCPSIAINPFCAEFLLNCNAFSYRLSRIQYPIKVPTCKRLDHLSNN
jgi:hypothetical protein